MPAPHNQGKTWTEEDRAKLVRLYKKGVSNKAIGKELGRSTFAIECQLSGLGYASDKRPSKKDDQRKESEMEPTTGQLMLQEALLDMKKGEVLLVRGIHSGQEYYITDCEPFVGRGTINVVHPLSGREYVEDMPAALDVLELVDVDLTQEYMVSVDGMQAPRKVHDSYDAACHEADRLARKHIGNRVRVLKVEHVIMAKQNVEVKECQ